MTTEEKAKAYDMALEGARKELGVDRKEWEVVQRVLHNIFPELTESEDKRITRAINNMLPFIPDEAYANNGVTKEGVLNWLEKQKPAEWSEEDEAMRADTLDSLRRYQLSMPNYQVELQMRWLKSLCPSWKPSEEQMKALIDCVIGNEYDVHCLVRLWAELKKL